MVEGLCKKTGRGLALCIWETRQFMPRIEQAPGPRGSPQLPHGPAEAALLAEPFAETANTESCGASFLLWHFGHSAFSLPYTSASNWWLHSLQAYSKIGITLIIHFAAAAANTI